MATIVPAPANRAAAITCRPTPPQPKTATDSPAWTRPTFRTAPNPVTTPQPSSAACHSGSSRGTGTAPPAATTAYSAKHAVCRPCCSGVPSGRRSRLVPSISNPRMLFAVAGSHRFGRPARQVRHARQAGTKQNATGSPGRTCVTPSPTSSTIPAPSWPSTSGQRPSPSAPSARWRSEWQTPAAATRTSTSPVTRLVELHLLHRDGVARFAEDRGADPHATR